VRPREHGHAAGRRRQPLDALPFLLRTTQPQREHAPAQALRGACQHRRQNEHGVSNQVRVHPRFYAGAMTE
jgi:hypothetical protein